jgi:NAD(P)-dependent dehydrogenase (short-subunit alcohol dehydrogenase family)
MLREESRTRRFEDQVAIITGAAAAGIGQTTARCFAQEGAHIVISDTHPHHTDEVAPAMASEYCSTPPGRMGQPGDIANAICSLVSDEASFVTGMF